MIPDDEFELPLKDRAYILRIRRDGATEDEFIPVATFTITTYQCGLRAGDRIRVLRDEGDYKKGEIFRVLTGAEEDPSCLWIVNSKGETEGWGDDFSIFDRFEKVEQ